jgi:hypothetical protein
MTRKKRRCDLFVYKMWGIFGGPPLPPTRKSSKLLNFRRSNLILAVVRSLIPLPVGPEKILKVLAWGACPSKFGPEIFPDFFLGLADDESYVWKHFQEFLLRKFFFIRPFMFYPMPRLLKFRNYTLV